MTPYHQDFKKAYISELFRQMWALSGRDWAWMEVEYMVGSVYYIEGTDYVYCTPACAQYLGGEDVPDDDNVMIAICRTPENGNYIEEGVLNFVLSYDMEQDLDNYHAIMTAYRAGLIRAGKEGTLV